MDSIDEGSLNLKSASGESFAELKLLPSGRVRLEVTEYVSTQIVEGEKAKAVILLDRAEIQELIEWLAPLKS